MHLIPDISILEAKGGLNKFIFAFRWQDYRTMHAFKSTNSLVVNGIVLTKLAIDIRGSLKNALKFCKVNFKKVCFSRFKEDNLSRFLEGLLGDKLWHSIAPILPLKWVSSKSLVGFGQRISFAFMMLIEMSYV